MTTKTPETKTSTTRTMKDALREAGGTPEPHLLGRPLLSWLAQTADLDANERVQAVRTIDAGGETLLPALAAVMASEDAPVTMRVTAAERAWKIRKFATPRAPAAEPPESLAQTSREMLADLPVLEEALTALHVQAGDSDRAEILMAGLKAVVSIRQEAEANLKRREEYEARLAEEAEKPSITTSAEASARVLEMVKAREDHGDEYEANLALAMAVDPTTGYEGRMEARHVELDLRLCATALNQAHSVYSTDSFWTRAKVVLRKLENAEVRALSSGQARLEEQEFQSARGIHDPNRRS